MKLVVRIFALSVVIAGAAAATVSSSTTRAIASHQAVSSALPTPGCGRHVCPSQPGSSTNLR